MELAIPIIALGGLFIISNQDKTKCKENFENYIKIIDQLKKLK